MLNYHPFWAPFMALQQRPRHRRHVQVLGNMVRVVGGHHLRPLLPRIRGLIHQDLIGLLNYCNLELMYKIRTKSIHFWFQQSIRHWSAIKLLRHLVPAPIILTGVILIPGPVAVEDLLLKTFRCQILWYHNNQGNCHLFNNRHLMEWGPKVKVLSPAVLR